MQITAPYKVAIERSEVRHGCMFPGKVALALVLSRIALAFILVLSQRKANKTESAADETSRQTERDTASA